MTGNLPRAANADTALREIGGDDEDTRDRRLLSEIERRLEHHLHPVKTALAEREDFVFVCEQNQGLAARVGHLEAVNRELEARVWALTTSTSWRITRPLRGLVRLWRGELPASRVMAWALGRVRRLRARPSAPVRGLPQPVRFPTPQTVITLPEVTGEAVESLAATVSVIVPTYNAGPEFYWLLRKLAAQKGLAAVEIVVVDSGSVDGTPELAEQLGCKVVRIPNELFDHSYARNLGAENATGELYLFTVQDAYPVGDYWLHALARSLLHPRCEAERIAAVSCAEFPRRDSEIFYNAAIDTHYRFLGCLDGDRIGEFRGDDQLSLRTQGQLSDVACMIPATTFKSYRYQGRYAEDLLLGVRLIRDGLRTGMLSSVKVVHSHTRPPAYHLKRNFVDLLFLAELFPDLALPRETSLRATTVAARQIDDIIRRWRPAGGVSAGAALVDLARQARRAPVTAASQEPVDLGPPGLSDWLARSVERDPAPLLEEVDRSRQMFAARLEHVAGYVERVYGEVDDHLARELVDAAEKCLAATIGAQLAVRYLSGVTRGASAQSAQLEELRRILLAGV